MFRFRYKNVLKIASRILFDVLTTNVNRIFYEFLMILKNKDLNIYIYLYYLKKKSEHFLVQRHKLDACYREYIGFLLSTNVLCLQVKGGMTFFFYKTLMNVFLNIE